MEKRNLRLIHIIFIIFRLIQTVNGQSNNNEQLNLIGKWVQEENENIIIEFTQNTFTNHSGRVSDYVIENGAIILILQNEPYSVTIKIAEAFEFIEENILKLIGGPNHFRIYYRIE